MKILCGSILAIVSVSIYMIDSNDIAPAFFVGALAVYLIIAGSESK